jgi:uncharacterized protein YcaQ
MTPPVRLSLQAARRLFLDRHALLETPAGPGSGAALADLIARLGFVQVDSVNTLARAHDLILWSRRPRYRPPDLRRLNDRARATFEHWTHDAAVIPAAFFPHWRLKFARDRARLRAKWRVWQGADFQGEIATVLDHVARHGPVSSADMAGKTPEKSTGWWDWHPSKTALEYLWRCGDLAITRREGFRKVYDLTERVLPAQLRAPRPAPQETVDWACMAALDRLGLATPGELAAFWALVTPGEAREWAAAARASGRVVEVEFPTQGGAPRRALIRPETRDRLADLPPAPDRIRVLSPFDPALRDRARAERLFGFAYRIEIFVPAARRRYGYYVFPVMQGERLVARAEIVADRAADAVRLHALWPEPGIAWGKTRQRKLEAELHRLTGLAGCAGVAFSDGWLREAADEI